MSKTDAEVIARSLTEPQRFGELFDRHFRAVYAFCARRLPATVSEEIAGEVFRRAFERRAQYDPERPDARPWLFTIARNLVRDTLRSSARERSALDRLGSLAELTVHDPAERAIASLDANADLVTITAALELMPTEEVECLLLRAWDSLSYAEIATVLDLPIGTVRSRLSRLRARLNALVDTPIAPELESLPREGGTE